MPYNIAAHTKLLQQLSERISEGLKRIERYPDNQELINNELVAIEAKIFLHQYDMQELEKDITK